MVVAPSSAGASAVVVVTTSAGWRGRDRIVLGSVSVEPGDRIRVGSAELFEFARSRASLLQRVRLAGARDELLHVRVAHPGSTERAATSATARDELARVSSADREGLVDANTGAAAAGAEGQAEGRPRDRQHGGPPIPSNANEPAVAVLPYPDGAGTMGLLPSRPGIYQRTYPLADLAAAMGPNDQSLDRLRSFLYYDDEGAARLAVLDAEVEAFSADGTAKVPIGAAPAWTRTDGQRSVTVAGLPHRDFPDSRLAAGERYGARPLRTFRVVADGDWVTVRGARTEVHDIEVAGLPPARILPSTFATGLEGDVRLHAVRLAAGDGSAVSAGLTFSSPSNGFAAAGQAVLRLPEGPATGWFELLAPSGQASWRTGRPFTLSDGQRGLLVRVDGFAASGGFMLLLALLFVAAAAPFAFIGTTAAVRAVAFAALGLAALRALLSVSAMVRYPFVDEGHQIGLWLIPALPWFACVLGRTAAGRTLAARPGALPPPVDAMAGDGAGSTEQRAPDSAATSVWSGIALPRAWDRSIVATLALGGVLVVLAVALFPASRAKQFVLAAGVVVVAAPAMLSALWPAWLDARRWRKLGLRLAATCGRTVAACRRIAGAPLPKTARALAGKLGHVLGSTALLRRPASSCPGIAWGVAILLLRLLLDAFGFREQMPIGGTRIGLSVIFTPLALTVFAILAARQYRRITGTDSDASGGRQGTARPVARPSTRRGRAAVALLDLCAYLTFAYAATSWRISDFGIMFTTLPGPLVVLALAAMAYARRTERRGGTGTGFALLGALPLLLFALLQAAPALARPFLPDLEGPRSGLEEWSRNDLLLLERGDPEALGLIGESRSEALAVMRETMRSYTRGNWSGQGFLEGRVSPQIRTTATREHVVTGLLASQWGAPGTLGLLALLAAALVPVLPASRFRFSAHGAQRRAPGDDVGQRDTPPHAGRRNPINSWSRPERMLAATALLTFSTAGAYMILANYGLVMFTGKNVYLLGLDSLGDTLEALFLLGLAAGALGWSERGRAQAKAVPAVPAVAALRPAAPSSRLEPPASSPPLTTPPLARRE